MRILRLKSCTGCGSHFENPTASHRHALLMMPRPFSGCYIKALDLSFNLAPWKWAWHYHEAATPSRRRTTFFTPRWPMLFVARGRGALLIMPRPLSGCQIKAEIKGFLLMYRLFQHKHWFLPNFELKQFPDSAFIPCRSKENQTLEGPCWAQQGFDLTLVIEWNSNKSQSNIHVSSC